MKVRKILAHLSISFGKSPVTGQNASVPNLFSATSLTLPPTASEMTTLLSMATLPHAPPLALSLADHDAFSAGAGEEGLTAGEERRGGGGGGLRFDIVVVVL